MLTLMGALGIIIFYIGHTLSDISWYTFVAAMVSKTHWKYQTDNYLIFSAGFTFSVSSIKIKIIDSEKAMKRTSRSVPHLAESIQQVRGCRCTDSNTSWSCGLK